jgi:hypothetical protein
VGGKWPGRVLGDREGEREGGGGNSKIVTAAQSESYSGPSSGVGPGPPKGKAEHRVASEPVYNASAIKTCCTLYLHRIQRLQRAVGEFSVRES